MDIMCEKIADGRVLSLIESFLRSGTMNVCKYESDAEDALKRAKNAKRSSNFLCEFCD